MKNNRKYIPHIKIPINKWNNYLKDTNKIFKSFYIINKKKMLIVKAFLVKFNHHKKLN